MSKVISTSRYRNSAVVRRQRWPRHSPPSRSEIIFASPLRRARNGDIIAQRLGLVIETDPRLKEINVGIFQGKRRDELPQLYPEEFARWKRDEPDFIIPGGESRKELERRGLEAFEAIRRNGRRGDCRRPRALLIVTMRAMVPDVADLRKSSGLENGSISTLALTAPGRPDWCDSTTSNTWRVWE